MKMRNKSKKIAVAAVMTAVTVVMMYLASILPTGRLGYLGIASLLGVAAVIESGISGGAMVYAASCILGILLAPSKDVVLIYALFFGYYPLLKSVAENQKKRILGWIIKLAAVNAALTILIFAFREMFFNISGLDYAVPIVYAVINAVFVLFDIGVSGVISFYMARIHRKIKR